eukprot:RCo041215
MLKAVLLAVGLAWAGTHASPSQMRVDELSMTSYCALPVRYHYDYKDTTKFITFKKGDSKNWTEANGGFIDLRQRIQFSYADPVITENQVIIELNGGVEGLGKLSTRFNYNLDQQEGFIPMNVEMSMWKDRIGGELVCEDSRIRTTYNIEDCGKVADTTVVPMQGYDRCATKWAPKNGKYFAEACTSDYAVYVNTNSQLYSKSAKKWNPSARSVGYSNQGWHMAQFSDGRYTSTKTGRYDDLPAINFECFEAPCKFPPDEKVCQDKEQVSVGNSGFNLCHDLPSTSPEIVAVMEVVLCPEHRPQRV